MTITGHDAPRPCPSIHAHRDFAQNQSFALYLHPSEPEIPFPNWTHLACPHDRCAGCGKLQPHLNAIVVSIAGATPEARPAHHAMGIGVQVRQNGFNISRPVRMGGPPSREKAELLACAAALNVVKMMLQPGMLPTDGLDSLVHVVIKTSSVVVQQGLCRWMRERDPCLEIPNDDCGLQDRVPDSVPAQGLRVPDRPKAMRHGRKMNPWYRVPARLREFVPLLVVLDALVEEVNGLGVWVQFWKVPERSVEGAGGLAADGMLGDVEEIVKGERASACGKKK